MSCGHAQCCCWFEYTPCIYSLDVLPASSLEGTRTKIADPEDNVRGTGLTFPLARTHVLSGRVHDLEVSSPWHISGSWVFYRMLTLFPPTPTQKSWFVSF